MMSEWLPVLDVSLADNDLCRVGQTIETLVDGPAADLARDRQQQLRLALQELLFNAIEHGNLEISPREKEDRLRYDDYYEGWLQTRREDERYRERAITIHVTRHRTDRLLQYRIRDQGEGFNWRRVLTSIYEPGTSGHLSGRGILLVQSFFPDLTYNDQGNEVVLTVSLQ